VVSPRRRKLRGQSLIEFGVSVPVLLILMVGAFTYGTLISDRVISGNAARAGARTAALLGSQNCSGACDPTAVDIAIVVSARTVAQSLAYATLTEVDIYPANCTATPPSAFCDANQYYNGSGTINRWNPNPATPTPIAGLPFTLNQRTQTPPNEMSIGVRLIYTYSPPISFLAPTLTITDYAVMKASPIY
jgi:Flp pilus assembly protein TadG